MPWKNSKSKEKRLRQTNEQKKHELLQRKQRKRRKRKPPVMRFLLKQRKVRVKVKETLNLAEIKAVPMVPLVLLMDWAEVEKDPKLASMAGVW